MHAAPRIRHVPRCVQCTPYLHVVGMHNDRHRLPMRLAKQVDVVEKEAAVGEVLGI